MQIYHVETQEDYNALMVELEWKGYNVIPIKGNRFFAMHKMCVIVFDGLPARVVSLDFASKQFPHVAIEKYKAKQNVSCKERINKELNESVRALGKALKDSKNNDIVNSPNHYTQNGRETIENIRDTMSSEGYQGYCVGNVVKYLARYKFKNGLEDVRKAKKYIEFLEEELMKQED
ncbi:DUF3310 domain-containing protein [Vagococcus fluvialis]|uniref:DUF3310 domain-containing protein n=1 Tax=Vagococcus fluvialis TaxID=2738 RepID=UPI003B2149AF